MIQIYFQETINEIVCGTYVEKYCFMGRQLFKFIYLTANILAHSHIFYVYSLIWHGWSLWGLLNAGSSEGVGAWIYNEGDEAGTSKVIETFMDFAEGTRRTAHLFI